MTTKECQCCPWDEKYEKLGVNPVELHRRQTGLCWLTPGRDAIGNAVMYCTDGEDKAPAAFMLNPTFECARCLATFAARVITDATKKE